ncbi:coiled-coil domain-containing protein 81 [Archocentrus centrarchus]|uniref:coiled-coil domain-containing protein 81 n=1 Tax=Archocentrus centrarchus TaxID=63155 RepID=UPI0011EA477D|nr:coiled-coil domain-containing protein 81 [Archocentrus centrarchus]
MKFDRDFINGLDGTGMLPLAFNKRPGSRASLLPSGLSRLESPHTANSVTLPTIVSPQPENKARDKDGWCLSPAPDQRNAGEVPQLREAKSHQTLQPAKVKTVSLKSEEPNPKPPVEARDRTTTSTSPQEVLPKLEEHLVNVNCSGHARAEQELCYLCTQRVQRNMPVHLRAKQQADERAQEKLLLLKQQVRDEQCMEEEQAKLKEQHTRAKQVAAFNLQMSAKKELTHLPVNPNSFIFPARPLTPPRSIQQGRYMNDIQAQIERRRKFKDQDEQNRLLMEGLDQIQLIQDIALQKAQQLQQKQEKTEHYKRALDTQVEHKKCTEPPDCHPDTSTFSRCDTAACNTESRERAQKIFQVNFSAAAQRKKELHNHQAQLEKEREMLRHNKTELILDRIKRFEKTRDISKSLEQEWSSSMKHKHKQEEDERRFLRSAGQLLVDKLAEYRCCCQCKRRTTNCGETNIWKDSRYPSGSKLMI